MRSKTYNNKETQTKKNAKSKGKERVKKSEVVKSSNGKPAPTANLDKGARDNDPNWYFTSPELAEQASQLSFQSMLGQGSVHGYQVPTITRIETVMNPGVTYRPSTCMHEGFRSWGSVQLDSLSGVDPGKSGVNMMAAKLYSTLSSFTGRTASYGPQDVAMMILQISSIAEISEWIRRAFGVALTYNARNRTLPLGLLKSMGLDVNDFLKNLSVYRMRYNVDMSRINQIPLLENIAYIKKSRDIYQRIYMDDPTNMSQLFYYSPAYYHTLDEAGDSDGSVLKARTFSFSNVSMDSQLSKLERMINAALESSTLNFIYADLINMANKLNVSTWQFDYLAENYVVMPEYNQNALLQFHNLTIMGQPLDVLDPNDASKGIKALVPYYQNQQNMEVYVTHGADVFCNANTNDIVYNPLFDANNINLWAWMVDMPTDAPSVEDRIEAIRFAALNFGNVITPSGISGATLTRNAYIFNVLPDHYVTQIYTFRNIDYSQNNPAKITALRSVDPDDSMVSLDIVDSWSQFEHAPLRAVAGPSGSLSRIFGGLQFYTMYDCYYAQRLLDVMLTGLWDFRV